MIDWQVQKFLTVNLLTKKKLQKLGFKNNEWKIYLYRVTQQYCMVHPVNNRRFDDFLFIIKTYCHHCPLYHRLLFYPLDVIQEATNQKT